MEVVLCLIKGFFLKDLSLSCFLYCRYFIHVWFVAILLRRLVCRQFVMTYCYSSFCYNTLFSNKENRFDQLKTSSYDYQYVE